jgi:hypothetical protein
VLKRWLVRTALMAAAVITVDLSLGAIMLPQDSDRYQDLSPLLPPRPAPEPVLDAGQLILCMGSLEGSAERRR